MPKNTGFGLVLSRSTKGRGGRKEHELSALHITRYCTEEHELRASRGEIRDEG